MAVIEAPVSAEDRAEARTRIHRVPTLVAAFLALLMLVGIGLAAPVAASGGSQADRVIAAASRHLGARYVWGSTGPHGFDCSGLVYRSFREAHLAKHIGGFNTAHGYYYSFRKQGQDRPDPRSAGRHRGLQPRWPRGHLPRPRQGHQRAPERRQGPSAPGHQHPVHDLHPPRPEPGRVVGRVTRRQADVPQGHPQPAAARRVRVARPTRCARCPRVDDSRSSAPGIAASAASGSRSGCPTATRAGPASR